jgi:hypothetical protein
VNIPDSTLTVRTARRGAARPAFVIAPVFLALAAWFLWGPDGLELPESVPAVVDASLLDTAPRRKALGDPPVIVVDGFERTCMDCHRLFQPRDDTPVELMQHRHVVLDHGINHRCRNCHHPDDRDRLVLHDGTVIDYSHVVELCAKCHGPTFRDWERGAHGRTNGYWDAGAGDIRRLRCTECHDPHQPRRPAMDPLRPFPGPNTIRMRPSAEDGHEPRNERKNPLRRWEGTKASEPDGR